MVPRNITGGHSVKGITATTTDKVTATTHARNGERGHQQSNSAYHGGGSTTAASLFHPGSREPAAAAVRRRVRTFCRLPAASPQHSN